MLLGLARHIERSPFARKERRVAPDLAADGAGAATQQPGNVAQRAPIALEYGQGVSFWLGELVVHGGSSLAGEIPPSLPAHLFFLAGCGCCTYFVNSRGLTMRSSRNRFVPPNIGQKKLALCLAPLRVSAQFRC